MQFTSLRPVLWTENFEKTIRFYSEVLGFTCAAINNENTWAALTRDNVEIMISAPNAHIVYNQIFFTGSFYIQTQSVDELWQAVKDKVKVCYEPENFEWGMREFAIYDNNGYILQFGEEV